MEFGTHWRTVRIHCGRPWLAKNLTLMYLYNCMHDYYDNTNME